MPATFARIGKAMCNWATPRPNYQGSATTPACSPAPGATADLQDLAIDHAAKTSGGKVGIVGYCWGGLLTWRAACTLSGLSAAAPYYGGGMTAPAEAARQPKVPVLAHFGDQDGPDPAGHRAGLQKAQPGVQVKVYAANHGFNCDHRASYNAEAAKLALERTLSFFAQHVG